MIAPEKPPLRIAYRMSSFFSLRTLKLGPLVRSPPPLSLVGLDPCAPAELIVWQPLHRSANRSAPFLTLAFFWSCLSRLTLRVPQPVAPSARAAATASGAIWRVVMRRRILSAAQ